MLQSYFLSASQLPFCGSRNISSGPARPVVTKASCSVRKVEMYLSVATLTLATTPKTDQWLFIRMATWNSQAQRKHATLSISLGEAS